MDDELFRCSACGDEYYEEPFMDEDGNKYCEGCQDCSDTKRKSEINIFGDLAKDCPWATTKYCPGIKDQNGNTFHSICVASNDVCSEEQCAVWYLRKGVYEKG